MGPKLIPKASELVVPQLAPAPGTQRAQERIIQRFWQGVGQQSSTRAGFLRKFRPGPLPQPCRSTAALPLPSPASKQEPAPPQAGSQHTHKPTRTQASIPKGMNRSQTIPDAAGILEGRGNSPQTSPAPHTVQQPQSNPALLHCPVPASATRWASTKKEQKKTTPNPWKILEKFFSMPGPHPTDLGFPHEANKEKPTVHKQ